MAIDVKQYLYTKGVDAVLDADFDTAKDYAKVRPGRQAIFWKNGLRRYAISVEEVQRVYRQLEPVIRSSICTGEKVAGFREKEGGRFREVALIRTPADLEAFKRKYGIDGEIPTIY